MATERYLREDYMTPARLHSYAHQLGTILKYRPERVLEVGVGSGYVKQSLELFGIPVDTLDLLDSNLPDVVGSVDDIPLPTDSYEMVSCCQVLEHLPYERSLIALRELARVSSSRVLLSLPDSSRRAAFTADLPRSRPLALSVDPPLRQVVPAAKAAIGHVWELGFRGYEVPRFRRDLAAAGLEVQADWRVPELPWHHFFDCRMAV